MNKDKMQEYLNKRKGMGPLSVLTMILVVLKLTNNIDWNWLYVLSPLWIPIVILLCVLVLVLPVIMCIMLCTRILQKITEYLKGKK